MILILLCAIALTCATGLGTYRHQRWARFVGVGLCVIGIAATVYWTIAATGHGITTVANFVPSDPNTVRTAIDVVGVVISSLLMMAFIAAIAVYLWCWQPRLASNSDDQRTAVVIWLAHRGAFFSLCFVGICALTFVAFYHYRFDPFWTAILVAIDGVIFVAWYARFRGLFGGPAANPKLMGNAVI